LYKGEREYGFLSTEKSVSLDRTLEAAMLCLPDLLWIMDSPSQTGTQDKTSIKMGNGCFIRTIGRVFVKCKIATTDQLEEGRWFHVLKKSVAPIIVGLQFIAKTKILTTITHLLEDCPAGFLTAMPTLKCMGSQATINFTADGENLTGCADTGADLNFMSSQCTKRNGFQVDRSPQHRSIIMLPDESEVTTVGITQISSMHIYSFDAILMTFHILPNLPFDVIFGDEFLQSIDAFNTCCDLNILDLEFPDLYALINLGPLQAWIVDALGRRKPLVQGGRQRHDDLMEVERYQRNKIRRDISNIEDFNSRTLTQAVETRRMRKFDRGHQSGWHCGGG
jgi:hypothetical protein